VRKRLHSSYRPVHRPDLKLGLAYKVARQPIRRGLCHRIANLLFVRLDLDFGVNQRGASAEHPSRRAVRHKEIVTYITPPYFRVVAVKYPNTLHWNGPDWAV
jgi:hypothetical protein